MLDLLHTFWCADQHIQCFPVWNGLPLAVPGQSQYQVKFCFYIQYCSLYPTRPFSHRHEEFTVTENRHFGTVRKGYSTGLCLLKEANIGAPSVLSIDVRPMWLQGHLKQFPLNY